jgi:uncharacterized protein (DUF2235 family)
MTPAARTKNNTNVAKLALALMSDRPEDGGAARQIVHYETGVGTSPDEWLIGSAFGYGLSRNICNAYRFLAQQYEQGAACICSGSAAARTRHAAWRV